MTGGGTGGHLTPLRSLAQEVKKQSPNCQLVYIGYQDDRFSDVLDKKLFDQTFEINAGKFRRYPLTPKTFLLNFRDIFRLIIGIRQSKRLLAKLKPDVVFSKGSFVAVPVLLAAKRMRIPVVTHDSDSVPGLANRLTASWAALHATGLPVEMYNYPPGKTVYVGIPVSPAFFNSTLSTSKKSALKSKYKIKTDRLLLIMGGSLGAGYINQAGPSLAKLLLPDKELSIIHIAGKKYLSAVKSSYSEQLSKDELSRLLVLGFSNSLAEIESLANVVLTRAGATSLAELAAGSKACVVVPSPHVSNGHQIKNAQWLARNGAAIVVEDGAETSQLAAAIHQILMNPQQRNMLSKKLHNLAKPQAAADLAAHILKIANR